MKILDMLTSPPLGMMLSLPQGGIIIRGWGRLWILLACYVTGSQSFNLDVSSPAVFAGPKNSYFGFSLALHSNSEGKWLLVGAPRDQSQYQTNLTQPGALYRCSVTTRYCSQVKLDDKGNMDTLSNRGGRMYKEDKNHMWLGMSLAAHQHGDGAVVVCGHLWKDRRYRLHLMANGACYETSGNLSFSSTRKLVPLTRTGLQIEPTQKKYLYALGQMGMSAHYTQDGTKLLLGAPGVRDWRGAIVHYDHPENRTSEYVVPAISTDFPAIDGYLGYAVTSGRFYSHDVTFYVAGAPRLQGRGKVYIYSGVFEPRVKISGNQVGAYFGAAVCAVDLNQDGLDDLLVGAPLYKGEEYEEGRVFVYINRDLGILTESQHPLSGSNKPGARFGFSIGAAGDLNSDGFHDIVVGAPYEDSGVGAVYVYLGSSHGIEVSPAQRISPSDLSGGLTGLHGFGFSLATGLDADGNQYQDVGVGVYGSDQALLLRARPVIHLFASLDFVGAPINLRWKRCYDSDKVLRTCVGVGFALKYLGDAVPEEIGLRVKLELDTSRSSHPRGFFSDPYGSSVWTGDVRLKKDVQKDTTLRVLLKKRIKDILTPVQFRLTFDLIPESHGQLLPILDKSVNKEIYNQVSFSKDCGEDEVCHSDLQVTLIPAFPEGRSQLILGDRAHFSFQVEVTNLGEAAYLTYIVFTHPDLVNYVNVRTLDAEDRVVCDPTSDVINLTRSVICEVGNPVLTNMSRSFFLTFDPTHATEVKDFMHFRVKVDSGSTEVNGTEEDNMAEMKVPLVIDTTMEITGASIPEIVFFDKKKNRQVALPDPSQEIDITEVRTDDLEVNTSTNQVQESHPLVRHLYDVKNRGPGLVPVAKLRLDIPTLTEDGQPIIHDMRVELMSNGEFQTAAGGCQSTEPIKHPQVGQSTLLDKMADLLTSNRGFNPIVLDCVNAQCVSHWCSIGQMSALDNVVITVTFNLNMSTLRGLDSEAMYIESYASLGEGGDYVWDKKVVTPVFSRKPQNTAGPVHWWVLVISVTMGLVLLIVIILVLKKCGFFRRPHYEDLQRLVAEIKDNEANEYIFNEDEENAQNDDVPMSYDPDGYLEAAQLNGYASHINGYPAGAVGGVPFTISNGFACKNAPSPRMSPRVGGNPKRKYNDYGTGKGKGKAGKLPMMSSTPPKGYDIVRGHTGQRLGEPSGYLCDDSEEDNDYSEIDDIPGLGYAGVGGYPSNNNTIYPTRELYPDYNTPGPSGYSPGLGRRGRTYSRRREEGGTGEDGYLEPCKLNGGPDWFRPNRHNTSTSSELPLVNGHY